MSTPNVPRESLLARHDTATLNLEALNADDLKHAARFWYGTTAANKMRKAECIRALTEVFRDRQRLKEALGSLPDRQQQILAVVRRYGCALSGSLLQCEVLARGLVEKSEERRTYYGRQRSDDPVLDLSAKLLLVSSRGGGSGRYDSYYFSSSYRRTYPDLVLHPAVRDLIEPAPPLSWQPSQATAPPTTSSLRPVATVALDLSSIAQALATNRAPGKRTGAARRARASRTAWPRPWPVATTQTNWCRLLSNLCTTRSCADWVRSRWRTMRASSIWK